MSILARYSEMIYHQMPSCRGLDLDLPFHQQILLSPLPLQPLPLARQIVQMSYANSQEEGGCFVLAATLCRAHQACGVSTFRL